MIALWLAKKAGDKVRRLEARAGAGRATKSRAITDRLRRPGRFILTGGRANIRAVRAGEVCLSAGPNIEDGCGARLRGAVAHRGIHPVNVWMADLADGVLKRVVDALFFDRLLR